MILQVNTMERVRVGVIGVGAFGESHVAAYSALPYVTVAAVCDARAARAQEIAVRYGVPAWYTDYRDLIHDTALNAVSITTPEDAHFVPTLAAIAAGKHVLVEKPIATHLNEAEQMVSAARDAGVYLMPGHILRFETRYALLKDRLASGELGSVVSIYARRNRPKSLARTYLRTHGVLEASVHDLDLILWYTGDRVKRVRAFQRSIQGYPNPDVMFAILELAHGALACIENNWLTPDEAGVGLNDAMQVAGTRGIAHIDFVNTGLSLWRDSGYLALDVSHEPRVRGEVFGALKEELAYFTRCVLEQRAPAVVSVTDALEGLRVALAIIASAEQERDIVLAEA
jgi:UDP-N-acetylglucosamine 3-dehydrogenase